MSEILTAIAAEKALLGVIVGALLTTLLGALGWAFSSSLRLLVERRRFRRRAHTEAQSLAAHMRILRGEAEKPKSTITFRHRELDLQHLDRMREQAHLGSAELAEAMVIASESARWMNLKYRGMEEIRHPRGYLEDLQSTEEAMQRLYDASVRRKLRLSVGG